MLLTTLLYSLKILADIRRMRSQSCGSGQGRVRHSRQRERQVQKPWSGEELGSFKEKKRPLWLNGSKQWAVWHETEFGRQYRPYQVVYCLLYELNALHWPYITSVLTAIGLWYVLSSSPFCGYVNRHICRCRGLTDKVHLLKMHSFRQKS